MESPAATAAAGRLERLAAYLAQDPANATLREDAWAAAMACGRHAQADAFLVDAPGTAPWQLRRAQVWIAQRRLEDARKLLEQLLATCGREHAIVHDLAYVHLLGGDAAQARALVQDAQGEPAAEQFQGLWLRACHHLNDTNSAWTWAKRARATGALGPDAAGVASLIALDEEEPAAAHALADAALAADPCHPEALVTRGSLALLAREPAEAKRFLERALQRNPDDGRTWSALGFASLLARDLVAAREQLEHATLELHGHWPTWQALGWTRMLLADVPGAMEAFHAALASAPQEPEAHGGLALACAVAGHAEAAEQHAAQAERLDPDDATARLARAVLAGAVDRGELQSLIEGVFRQ